MLEVRGGIWASGTTSDLTSEFMTAGVGTKDTTITPYTPDKAHVKAIADAHCSIAGAKGDSAVTSTTLNTAATLLAALCVLPVAGRAADAGTPGSHPSPGGTAPAPKAGLHSFQCGNGYCDARRQ